MADEDIKYQLYTYRTRLQRLLSTPFEPASLLPKLSYRVQILDQDLTRTLDTYLARQSGKGGLIIGVLGGLSGNVQAEVEELGRIREEARRVARDIEEALRMSESVCCAAAQERKVAVEKELVEDAPQYQ
jgi:hypothetical protein